MAMNQTVVAPAFLNTAQLHYLGAQRPLYYDPAPSIFTWLPDHYLAVAAPVIVYWVVSLFFHALDMSEWQWLNKYRIHDSAEVKSKNLASRMDVVWAVLFQQLIQTLAGLWWIEEQVAGEGVDHIGAMLKIAPYVQFVLRCTLGEKAGGRMSETNGADILYYMYWWAIPIAQFFGGMFIIDTWQYFLHRGMHMNTYLYKKIHSVHHRLYVPYAFGALYNHPVEGFLLDSLGAGIAELLTGMAVRETVLLFAVSTMKTVDDHCGYNLPWDPLQLLSGNNADYHDIHHQVIGIKSNFSQPFFIHWDVILGTRMTRKDIELRRQKRGEKKAE